MHAFRKAVERLDTAVYKIERGLLLACVSGMTILIFLQVVQRSFSRDVGKSTEMLAALVGKLSGTPWSEATMAAVDPWFFWGFAVVFLSFAVHASRRNRGAGADAASFAQSVAIAIALTLVARGGIYLMRTLLPTGVPGAQKFSLGLLVWAGLLGATIITRTRGHIVIDAVKKKMGDDVIGVVSLASGTLTAGFCGVIVWLGAAKAWAEYLEWVESEHLIALLYESAPIPQAVVTAALPVCFGLIGIRFFAQGISDFVWGPPLPKSETGDVIELDALERNSVVRDEVVAPALPSLVFGQPRADGGGQ